MPLIEFYFKKERLLKVSQPDVGRFNGSDGYTIGSNTDDPLALLK